MRLWGEVKHAEVVHLHDVAYFGNWAAFIFARLQHRPVLVTQHAGAIRYPSGILRLALWMMHRFIVRPLLAGADRVVFISPVARDYFGSFVRFRRAPLLIWNGVDSDIFAPASTEQRAAARMSLGLTRSQKVVLFVGRFVVTKGLRTIEQLVALLPEVTWVLAGWGPIDPGKWQAANVRVFSSLRGRELVPLYQSADLLVLPSHGEGLPLVVQEAMACGTPVLVDTATARAIDAPASMVFAASTREADAATQWSAAIQRLLPELAAQSDLAPRVAQFAKSRWSWRAAEAQYSDLFAELSRKTVRDRSSIAPQSPDAPAP